MTGPRRTARQPLRGALVVVTAVAFGLSLLPGYATSTSRPQPQQEGRSLWGIPLQGGLLTRPLCDRPVFVRGQGPSCPAPGGLWQVLFDDGTSGITHGFDTFPIHGHDAFGRLTPRKPSCVSSKAREYHVQMVYAHASDRPDRYGKLLSKLRDVVYRVNGMLYKEAAEFNRKHLYRMACSGTSVSVRRLKMPVRHANVNYSAVVSAARNAGLNSTLAKYWIFYDGGLPGAPQVGGEAMMLPDDDLKADNLNNFGPSYGVFYGRTDTFGIEALMHEGSHSMGAVQNSAPRSTGNAHCLDDLDVMCYPENESVAARFDADRCSRTHFDCGHDDYYNPKPSSRNYLRTHWNLGSPLNRFFAGCQYKIGSLIAPAPGGVDPDAKIDDVADDWEEVSARSHSISSSCDKHTFALYGSVVPPTDGGVPHLAADGIGVTGFAQHTVAAAIGRAASAPVDFNVCFYRGSKTLRCYTAVGTDTGTVPYGATKARVFLNAGANATYVLSIV